MHPLLESWKAGLVDADLLVDPDDPAGEAQANLWWFGLTPEQAAVLDVDDVVAFMRVLTDVRRAQVVGDGAAPTTLCWWYDPTTGQLRCSVASAAHGRLPVGDVYEIVEAPDDVAAAWLAASVHAGLPLADPVEASSGAAAWESASETPAPPATWLVALP